MPVAWSELAYADWRDTCDTLHAHTQVLGKLAVVLAPPEPRLQHSALRLTARGWETYPLPAPDGSGSIVALLDLHAHEARVEHSDGRTAGVQLAPNRPVGTVTREFLAVTRELVGPVQITMTPQEVHWTVPLDEDEEHHTYDTSAVGRYMAAATGAALVLAEFRAPHTGRSTPVSAWWGSFDLSASLFAPAPGGEGEVEVAVGWWPGDPKHQSAAFYAYASPASEAFAKASFEPAAARWDQELGEALLDWEDVRASTDPHHSAVSFARSAYAAATGA
jgi:hypothetical protein